MMEPAQAGYPVYDQYHGYQAPERRSWFGALLYWNRRYKHYKTLPRKAWWWLKFLAIAGLLPEGLIDAVSAIPGLGTPLIPIDFAELPAEGVGGFFVAWLIAKLFIKLVFKFGPTWEALKEISDMRDRELHPPYQWSRWMPSWLPD